MAAHARVRHLLPTEAEDLQKNRVRIISFWCPLNGPVQCSTLAFADSKTVSEEALVSMEHRYLDRTDGTLSVKHMDEQWYHCSGLENDERLLLECFDSEKGGRVPHTAFVDHRSPVGERQRESIEVRALSVWMIVGVDHLNHSWMKIVVFHWDRDGSAATTVLSCLCYC